MNKEIERDVILTALQATCAELEQLVNELQKALVESQKRAK